MARSSNDTYAGSLEVLMKQLAVMKGLPDANLPFLIELETAIIGEIRSPERQMQQAGILPQGMPGAPGPTAPMQPGGASAPPPSFMGAGVPGAGPQQAPAPANPDELRRVLTAPNQ